MADNLQRALDPEAEEAFERRRSRAGRFSGRLSLIKAEGLRVRRERGGVSVILTPPAISAVNLIEGGFTCRLATSSQAGDRLFVYSELPAARMRSHALNGAVRTATLEGDATEAQAQ
ncbi:hypothetical protein D3C87_1731200 [compost metagenome]